LVSFIFFVSGAAGLIFEVVWFYRCSLAFGNSAWAASLVLSSFMTGLALGGVLAGRLGPRLRRPLLGYAAVECIAAVTGVALTLALPTGGALVASLTRGLGDVLWAVNLVRVAVAFAMLVVPATAIGTTLPLLVGERARLGAEFRVALGRLYGCNTLGAVTGALLAETVLIERVGVVGAAVTAAVLLLLAAALAAMRSRSVAGASLRPDVLTPLSPKHGGSFDLALAAFLSGALLLALEVVWFRLLSMYVLATTLAMSAMLAAVLAAIAVGGLAASFLPAPRANGGRTFGLVAIAAGLSVIASYVVFARVTSGTQVGALPTIAWFAGVLAFPAACASGLLFPLIGDALRARASDARCDADIRAAATLAWANALGAACGPPIAVLVLLPWLGMERALFAAAAGYGAIAWLGLTAGGLRAAVRSPAVPAAAAAFVVALAVFPFGLMRRVFFERAAAAYAADGSTIVATREGPTETIFLMQQRWLGQPVYSRLVTNGFSMSGTSAGARRYMRYFAYWPMLVHKGPMRRALVVCYGVGVTAAAAGDIPSLEAIDVVEISKDVAAMSDVIYASGGNPLLDPRVRLHIEDGRAFLQRTSDRFDLITGEPPPPRTPDAVAIYTREYFQLIRDRLADGGIATYWLPIGRPNPGTDVNTIIRAFCDVFDDCSLWNATPFDVMLAGTRGAPGPVSITEFARPWDDPHLGANLRDAGFELPQQIGATFIGDASFARGLAGGAPPLVDDYPQRLRPVAGRPSLSDPRYGSDPAATMLYDRALDPVRARRGFETSPLVRRLFPTALIEQSRALFGVQRIINTVLFEGAHPLRRIEDLHAVLTTTRLRTLPLWMLGSDPVKQGIAHDSRVTDGAVSYARALDALVARDYPAAAAAFQQAERAGLPASPTKPLEAYALCAAGERARAREIARGFTARDADERHFAGWFAANCER
jgi:predicted membrane-bound spermidine synthase